MKSPAEIIADPEWIFPPATLDSMGRCCGRKPHPYKRPRPYLVCFRCSCEFDPATGKQRQNWAWISDGENFRPTYVPNDKNKAGDYARQRRAMLDAAPDAGGGNG